MGSGRCTTSRKTAIQVAFALTFVLAIFGCGKKDSNDFTSECVMPPEQANSIKGFWSVRPAPLAVEYSDFDIGRQNIIGAAIDSWNAFSQASRGYPIFAKNGNPIQNVNGSQNFTATSVGSSSIIAGPNFSGRIMIRKRSTWPSSGPYSSSQIALSSLSSVSTNGSNYRVLTNAVMEINFQHYYSAGRPSPDFQTIVLHELGHIAGLGHSCGDSGVVACNVNTPQAYLDAVMYPSPTATNGNGSGSRRILRANDQERFNCAYPAAAEQ